MQGQVPVGQGCFSYGRIQLRSDTRTNSSFLYVHDCGGRQDLVVAGVATYLKPNEKIDALYISHFDDDHVSGLEHLLDGRSVTRAFIPVLDDNAKLRLFALAATSGAVSQSLQEFITTPATWLTSRGVSLVRVVNSDPDNTDPSEPEIVYIDREGDGNVLPRSSSTIKIALKNNAAGTSLFWILKSFSEVNHDPDFLSNLNRHFNLGHSDEAAASTWILSNLKSGDLTAKEMKDFFLKHYSTDHNRVSLCLFSGPLPTDKNFCAHEFQIGSIFGPLNLHACKFSGGWMHTADYPFRLKKCVTRFLSYYESELNSTSVFMLSHHGADQDFQEELLDAAPNAFIAVVPVGSNRQYGHPSDRAMTALLLRRVLPVLVMDDPSDYFEVSGYFWPL